MWFDDGREVFFLLVRELGAEAHHRDNDGNTLLHFAARSGDQEVIRLIVSELGRDVNATEIDDRTPLHVAAQHNRLDALFVLFKEFGADVGARLRRLYPLTRRIERRGARAGKGAARTLTPRTTKVVPPFISLRRRVTTSRSAFLLMNTAQPDTKSRLGMTPLHVAAWFGNHPPFFELVWLGANVHLKDNDNNTILHIAAWNGDDELISVIVERLGGDPSANNSRGLTPLHFASERGHREASRVLVNKLGADVNAKDCHGRTPLRIATGRFHFEIGYHLEQIRFLVKELGSKRSANVSTFSKPSSLLSSVSSLQNGADGALVAGREGGLLRRSCEERRVAGAGCRKLLAVDAIGKH